MNFRKDSSTKPILDSSVTTSNSESNSITSSSATTSNKKFQQLDRRLWRAIDFLHLIVMLFSLYTAIIVAILRNDLSEQCPLYAKLYLRDNATHFADSIDRQSTYGSVYTCEFASFAYLSAFVVSFISLWVHIVFRRVLRTERLLRLPIGLLILIFSLIAISATIIVTDGVIKFCSNSQANICSTSGPQIFSSSRWKLISLPVGGWLTTLSILLTAVVRGIQLFSKPKKSPETLKLLLNQLMTQKQQHKIEKEVSNYGSQISYPSRDKHRSPMPSRRYSTEHTYNREFSPELYPYYYPSVPQFRQIEKRSRFQRICCPCFRRRRRRRSQHRSLHESYRPYVVPEEYFHRLNHLKQNGTVSPNPCHHHSMHHPTEQQTQADLASPRHSIDQTHVEPFLGRRRSSVRFEDETPLVKTPNPPSASSKTESTPVVVKQKDEPKILPVVGNDLERNVSFRNNEDDLWTTVTITAKQSESIHSSHFNRLSLENLSCVNTATSNNDNGVTAIHINTVPTEVIPTEIIDKHIPLPPSLPRQPSSNASRNRQKPPPLPPPLSQVPAKTIRHRYKPPLPPPSRTHTTSSEDDTDLRNIKPVEEINTLVAEKYSYNDVSRALKSNVERLKNTFIQAQDTQSHYDKPSNILRTTMSENRNTRNPSSDC